LTTKLYDVAFVVLVLEESKDLLQIHLVAEQTHLDPRNVSWYEAMPEWGFFGPPERGLFSTPFGSSEWDLLGRPFVSP
jgi:hypothetical protein